MTPQAESDADVRQLAQGILLVIEPLLQAASALGVGAEGAEPGYCHNDWCPLCAAAAMSHGVQHPLVDIVIATCSTVIAMFRAAAYSDVDDSINDDRLTSDESSPRTTSGYEHIPVTLVD